MHPVIQKLHEAQLRKDLPDFRPGDSVRVNVRLQESEGEKVKERIQAFEGIVISKKGRASSAKAKFAAPASIPSATSRARLLASSGLRVNGPKKPLRLRKPQKLNFS